VLYMLLMWAEIGWFSGSEAEEEEEETRRTVNLPPSQVVPHFEFRRILHYSANEEL
jgi:hypothetical protein